MAEHVDGGHASTRAGAASLAAAPAGAFSARSLWTTQRTVLPFVNQLRLRVRAAEWGGLRRVGRESTGLWASGGLGEAGGGWWNPRLLQMCREADVKSLAALPFIASRSTLGGGGCGGGHWNSLSTVAAMSPNTCLSFLLEN